MGKRKSTRKKKKLDPEEKQKLPYIPLYTGDYIKDTRDLSLEAKGAWSDMILFMWSTNSKGVLTGTIDDFTRRIGSTSAEQTSRILTELALKKVADVARDKDEIIYTVSCRRLVREARISEVRTKAVQNRYKNGTNVATNPATKSVQNPDNENENEAGNVTGFVIDPESYGKSENYFHGPVPADLVDFANNLQPSPLKSEAWQRDIQTQIQALGYTVTREVACPYPSEDGEEIQGFIDLQATKNGLAIGIELDNRVTTRDSVAKVMRYAAGMVLLRDPKPTVTIPARPMVTSDTFSDASFWTEQVISNNDVLFNGLLKNRGISPGEHLAKLARDHLDLTAKYAWHKKWDDQNGFRHSLVSYITKELPNLKPKAKKNFTADDFKDL